MLAGAGVSPRRRFARSVATFMRVLVVEDDRVVGDAVQRALTLQGFAVDHVVSAEHARAALHADDFDLAIVDIGLPKDDGLTLVRDMRRRGINMPVLMLTARDGLSDRVTALDLGADDYLTKPFQVAELLAPLLRALVRRASGRRARRFAFGPLQLDLAHREATCAGNPWISRGVNGSCSSVSCSTRDASSPRKS